MKKESNIGFCSLPETRSSVFQSQEHSSFYKNGLLNSEEVTENLWSDSIIKPPKKYSAQLETTNQVLIERMIREEIQQQGRVSAKMTLDDDEVCLCASDIYTKNHSFWKNREISQITTKRLDSIPIPNIKKIKVLSQHPMVGYNLFRISVGEKQVNDFAIRTVDIPLWFCNAIWTVLLNAGHQIVKKKEWECEIEGKILKKSQFLGKWQLRYCTISSKSGMSWSKKKGEMASLKIKQTSQLWSRLQIVDHEDVKYVVFKTWHMMLKYQFAFPLVDCLGWAKSFSSLIK